MIIYGHYSRLYAGCTPNLIKFLKFYTDAQTIANGQERCFPTRVGHEGREEFSEAFYDGDLAAHQGEFAGDHPAEKDIVANQKPTHRQKIVGQLAKLQIVAFGAIQKDHVKTFALLLKGREKYMGIFVVKIDLRRITVKFCIGFGLLKKRYLPLEGSDLAMGAQSFGKKAGRIPHGTANLEQSVHGRKAQHDFQARFHIGLDDGDGFALG